MSSSPPTFPQEVIDKIVNDLEPDEDLPDLLNCSLISKSFLAASHRVLFNQLTIGTDDHDAERAAKDCRGLYTIVAANPRLGTYIKSLVLQDTPSSHSDPENGTKFGWILHEETLPLLLPLLVSLKGFSIRASLSGEINEKLDWSTFPSSLAASLSRTLTLPNLVKIEVVDFRNLPTEIVTFSKYLKTLSFWGTDLLDFDENSSSSVLGSAQPLVRGQLESMDIVNCPLIIPVLMKSFTRPGSSLDLSCLKTLRVGMSCADDLTGWSTLGGCVSQTMEQLDVIHMFPSDEQFCFPHELLDLRPFPNLRVFSLDIAYYLCENDPQLDILPILLDQLRQLTSDNNLEVFRLLAEYRSPAIEVQFENDEWLDRFCRRPFWRELDLVLMHPRLSKLRRVEITFKGLADDTDSGSDLQMDSEHPSDSELEPKLHHLRKQMPGLISKNIIYFEFIHE